MASPGSSPSDRRDAASSAAPPMPARAPLADERYRALMQRLPYGIALSTPDGILTEANPAFAEILGYESANRMVGMHVTDLYVDVSQRATILSDLQRSGYCRREALEWKRGDGRAITVRFTAWQVADPRYDAPCVEATIEDITERLRMEERYHQAQRMEAIGRLAGGVAHDFNNLLTVILTTTELMLEDVAHGSRHAELQDVYRSAQQGAELTRQLLAFSRRQVLASQPLSVNHLISDIVPLLQRFIGDRVRVRTALAAADDIVRLDAGQFEQVLMNLAVNARDAMPDGGDLLIETESVDLTGAGRAPAENMARGPYVLVTVGDTGPGMAPDVKSHAFEPFFTTKGKDKGTGLGLATVYGIVKQFGGYVWVYSELGRGTTFKIYLPRVGDAPRARAEEPSRHGDLQGHEIILIAEDEPGIRALLVRVLTSRGYTVIAEASGEQALRQAVEHPGRIDVLVTDVVMAGMTGPELARRLAEVHPETAALFLSGYTDEVVLKMGVAAGNVAFLQKPFTHSVFLAKVREVLDRQRAGQAPAGPSDV